MAKRKMSENSLKNLETGKCYFSNSREIARNCQKKSVAKRKENKLLEDVKNEIIEKCFSKVNDLLDKEELTSTELRDLFKTAVDMSGFKKEKVDATVKSYSLFEADVERKADAINEEPA